MPARTGLGFAATQRLAVDLHHVALGHLGADAGALPINVDGAVMATTLKKGQTLVQPLAEGRAAYIVPAKGAVVVNGHAAAARDGIAIREERAFSITASEDAELVMVEVAAD